MKFTRPLALGVAVGLAIGAFGAASTASAEPVSNSYVLVGSDTLQDSLNALTNGTSLTGSSVRVTANGAALGNYDAFGSTLIQTKTNGAYFERPSGSGNGRQALVSSITGSPWKGKVITGQVDIARSSDGPGADADDDGDLLYVPYGRDAVAYAFVGPNGDLGSLTTAQLKQIYESNTPVKIGGTDVKPLIPQDGSGTRKFFLKTIGVSTLGSQVSSLNNTLPENDAAVLTEVGNIVPFSAASWIAQANGASGVNTIPTGGAVKLGSPNGVAPFSGTSTLTPSTTFYNSAYGRDTYVIVEYARVNSGDAKYDAALAALINPATAQGLTNFGSAPATAGAVKRRFGFLPVADTTPIRAFPNVY